MGSVVRWRLKGRERERGGVVSEGREVEMEVGMVGIGYSVCLRVTVYSSHGVIA